MCVFAYNPDDECFYIVDEYLANERTTEKHAEEIQRLIDKWNIDVIFIDAAAAQMAADFAYTYDISTTKAKKDILPGIVYCQSKIDNGKVYVHQNCTNTLDALDQYQWDSKDTLTKDRPLHNEFSHMADALRYALYTYTL